METQVPPEGYVNKKCTACSSWIKVIYHQRRAADEPPDAVEYCEKCPLNTNSLSTEPNYIDDYVPVSNRKLTNTPTTSTSKESNTSYPRKRLSTGFSDSRSLYVKSTGYVIVVDGAAANNCYSIAISESRKFQPLTAIPIVLETQNSRQVVNLYTSSSMTNQAHYLSEERRIAPMVTLSKIDTYSPRGSVTSSYREVVVSRVCLLDTVDYVDRSMLEVTREGKQCRIKLFLSDVVTDIDSNEEKVLDVLHQVLTLYGHENSIKSFIPATLLNSCYVNSGHAYDYPTAPSSGYKYTWKPDGERFWLVKYGCVWFFVRRLLSGKIQGWCKPRSMKLASSVGPILDVEVLIGHSPILIDVLVMGDGQPTSNVRSLPETLDNFDKLLITDIDVFVRKYYATHEELLATKNTLRYPVDGTIGIKDDSMTIIKLKSEKSIELRLLKDGSLVAQEGKVVANMTPPLVYPEDSILELRFTKVNTEKEYSITEVISRTDKLTANSYKVCKDIINTIQSMPDNLARRNAVLWCNSIRRRMNENAAGSTGRGRVILDIGAGDGQSVSDYSTSPEVTYILLEPNFTKCTKLSQRLSQNSQGVKQRLFTSPDQILLAAKLASTKAVKYAIVCSTLESILKVDGCLKALVGCVRHCISCFSISYVSKELRTLSIKGLNVIGCGYFYDGIDINSYLVKSHGVTMKRVEEKKGAVTWGSDRVYEEPVITSKDFELFNVKLASEVIPIVKGSEDVLLNTISKKVYIISNGRNV